MLLFSTILEIDKKLTKDDFINLVIEWNQKGHPESVISGIEWNGERNVRYEDENKCLEIQEYRNKNIIAVRFEKRESDGAVWDTDYIMNFSEMKMAVRLDRSYIEEALNVDTKFFTPFFISMLIDRGYILKDGNLEVRRTPLIVDEENLDLIVNVTNGSARYKLPVVIITKTFYDEDPVDINKLAKELKGVAHVLVQKTNCTNPRLKELCDGNNEYYGAIGIYHPNPAIGHRRYAKLFLIKLQQEDGKSYSSIHTIRGVLRPAFQMAVDDDILVKNPFGFQLAGVLVNDAVTREAITKDQMRKFLKFVHDDVVYCKYYEVVYILFHTGMRISDDDDKIRLNQRKPSKYKGLRRFGPEKNLQRINKFMKERPIFYKNLIQMKENIRFYLRCFYCITKVMILQFNSENRTELARNG